MSDPNEVLDWHLQLFYENGQLKSEFRLLGKTLAEADMEASSIADRERCDDYTLVPVKRR